MKMRLCGIVGALLIGAALLLAPGESEAGLLQRVATRAVAKRVIGAQARATANPTSVIVHRTQHPAAAAHIEHAQKNGQPTVLTLDRARAAERRGESLRGVKDPGRHPGLDRDEYPPAMTREGGHNATVHFIDAHDNRGAGASIRWQTNDLPDGARIRVIVTD